MLHACVRKFDVISTLGKNLGTKRGLIRELKTNNKDAEITVAAASRRGPAHKNKGKDKKELSLILACFRGSAKLLL